MASPSYPVSSIGTLLPDQQLCTRPLSSPLVHCPPFHCRDQAPGSTSLLSFVSDAAIFPGPLLLKDCGFDPFSPSAGGSHQAMDKQWPNAGCNQERLLDPDAAGAPRLRPGASPPPKKFAR